MTYTKTVTTITMEPTGNVSHTQTSLWFAPCSEAPSLPPVGAPDPAIVTGSVSLIGRPQADHIGGHSLTDVLTGSALNFNAARCCFSPAAFCRPVCSHWHAQVLNVLHRAAGDDGFAAGPNIDDSTIIFGPGVSGASAPASTANTLAALLAALSPSRLCAHHAQANQPCGICLQGFSPRHALLVESNAGLQPSAETHV